ncbi:tetratricopeptide repeat protein [Nannocystis pusilla]|uniref:tetratricopeptide repeat protein n=1 Tax=Nannocystis pusilla TaxID=889268 RepID=UPI003B7CCFC0
MKQQSLDAIVDRGLAAVDDDDLKTAEDALEEAARLGGENHVRVLHLAGMVAWAQGRLDQAAGYLMQAADGAPEDPQIYLDCAECLLSHGEDLDEAEAAARAVLRLEGADTDSIDQARLLLAQIRLSDDDTDEALELLEGISAERKNDAAYLSIHGFVLMNSNRPKEAAESLGRAVAVDPEDPDVHYWYGQALEVLGDVAGARAEMLKVLELDARDLEDHEPVSEELAEDLRGQFEALLEDIPDQVLKLVATAPITVQARPSTTQVEAGADPRGIITFVGRARTDDAEARLDSIVLMRDFLLDEIEGDDDIPELLMIGLVDELRRFFRLEGLEVATGTED